MFRKILQITSPLILLSGNSKPLNSQPPQPRTATPDRVALLPVTSAVIPVVALEIETTKSCFVEYVMVERWQLKHSRTFCQSAVSMGN